MLSLSIIVAGRNQTRASRMEDALTAVITHRHGDHFWPAVDGRRRPLLQSAFIRLGCQLSGRHGWAGHTVCVLSWVPKCF